jgi:trimeric autotransporter adhesin
MYKIYSILAGIILSASAFSQVTQKMSYQAVIRTSNNELVVSAPVGMKISILQGSESGTVAYSETLTPSTNINGLVSLEIGSGTPVTGTLEAINWATGPYFIQSETDPTGGTVYSITGISELMSVPYALYAANAGDTWAMTGNASTDSETHFIGTTDSEPLILKVNNSTAGFIGSEQTSTSFGYLSLSNLSDGLYNTSFGYKTLNNCTEGSYNTGVGYESLVQATGTENTAVGYHALSSLTTSIHNTAIGCEALLSNTASANTAVGFRALRQNTTGAGLVAIGTSALYSNTEGNNNTSVGQSSLFNNTTGTYNTGVGNGAMSSNVSGTENTAVGYQALKNNVTSIQNTAIGTEALLSNTASANTAVGFRALRQNTTGGGLVAIGTSALSMNTEGNNNTSVGQSALFSTSTGSYNAGLGNNSMFNNSTGSNNTAIGFLALSTNTTGSQNIAIGAQADMLNNAIAIGYNAKVGSSNSLVLGGTGDDAVNVGIGVTNPARSLHISSVMRLEPIPTEPTSPEQGDIYFDSTLNKLRVFDGTLWQSCW